MRLFHKLATKLNYVSVEEMNNTVDSMRDKLMELTQENIKLQDEIKQLNSKYQSVEAESMLKLKNENDELNARLDKIMSDCDKAEEFYKTVQEMVSKALSEDSRFKFGSTGGIPGSSHVGVSSGINSNEETEIVINGRTVFLDEITDKIQHATSMNEKYSIALNQLIKYGLLEKVAQRMIQSGALEFTLGYNQNCTSLELFYQITCKKPDSLLNIDYIGK